MKVGDCKTCNTCGEVKPLTEYHKVQSNRDGHNHTCKPCKSAIDKKYREANKEKLLAQKKEYYQKNKENFASYWRKKRECPEYLARKAATAKAYREKLGDAYRERSRVYYHENKARILAEQKVLRSTPEYKVKKAASDKAYREANAQALSAQKKVYHAAKVASSPCAIYMIVCTPEQRYYIGQTGYAQHRFTGHQSNFRNNVNSCGVGGKLQEDYNKHGPDSFDYIVLKELSPNASEEMRLKEEKKIIFQFLEEGKWLYNDTKHPEVINESR